MCTWLTASFDVIATELNNHYIELQMRISDGVFIVGF